MALNHAGPFKQNIEKLSAGAYGADYITDTATHAGPYGALAALEDTVIDSIVATGVGGTSLNGATIPKGMTILDVEHLYTDVKLTSGKFYAYKAGV